MILRPVGADLTLGNGPIGDGDQLGAAAAHLNRHLAQRRAVELEPRGLVVIGTTHAFEFARRVVLELVDQFLWRQLAGDPLVQRRMVRRSVFQSRFRHTKHKNILA